MASSVSLPLVVWYNLNNPNVTCITCSHTHIYAGQKDGSIWVYTLVEQNRLEHKLMLVGHKSAVVALCILKAETDALSKSENVLISASEDGEIARWNASDGRCQAVNPNGFYGVPRFLKVFSRFSEKHIFCCGQSNEITILNASNLEIVRVWGGHSNWVSCIDFFDPDTQQTRLLTATVDGKLDIWDFDSAKHIIYKDKSSTQTIQFDVAFDLVSNPFIPSMFMILTDTHILVMDKNLQCSIPIESDTHWVGGSFVSKDHCIVWTLDGQVFDYQLNLPGSKELVHVYRFDPREATFHTITSILRTSNDKVLIVTLSNHPESSGFSIIPLSLDRTLKETTYSIDTTFSNIWPLVDKGDSTFGNITATAPVDSNRLAIGYASGTICIVPLSLALLHLAEISHHLQNRDDVLVFQHAHRDAVTCMIVPEHHGQHYLLSGGQDGAVKIWNLIDAKYIASCAVHSMPVASFIEPAEQKDTRVRGCVISVAQDNSLALISVDSMTCLFIFPGYPHPLTKIQWRTAEDYLVFGYHDDSAYVWQMQTAHLDRILHGKNAQEVLEDERWPINNMSQKSNSSGSKQTVQVKSIMANDNALHASKSFAQIFTVNIRRLVHDLYTRLSQPQEHLHPILKASLSSSFDAVVPDMLTFTPDKDEEGLKAQEKKMELVSAIMSVIVSWQISEAFEQVCCASLQLSREAHPNISYGLKGANGNLSLLAPLKHERQAWAISPSMTAIRLLSIALLTKAIACIKGQENKSSDLISGYAMSLPLIIGQGYCFPSLSLLSKYWQDPSARSLFSSAIAGLSKQDVESLVDYWEAFLPTSNSSETNGPQMMARASIVLGIMGCDQPHTLSPRVRKSTALSLTILLSDAELDESRHHTTDSLSTGSMARTLSSMELLSQGFQTWETYINAAEVLRTLFMYAADTQPIMALVSRGAKTAIFQISTVNMPLVINTLTFDTMHAKSFEDRLRCLNMIGSFVRKEPVLLYSHVHSVVEAVVKTLDPNVPHLREVMLSSATSILHDLVKMYPTIDFSSSAQKLAVGTLEGASVIYDVRTATRSIVLEGHIGPVSVLAFSPDAKLIATCSLVDQSVRVWHTHLSLLGMITSSFSQGLSAPNPSGKDGGSQRPHKVFSFAMPDNSLNPTDIVKHISFEWTSNNHGLILEATWQAGF